MRRSNVKEECKCKTGRIVVCVSIVAFVLGLIGGDFISEFVRTSEFILNLE